MSDWQVGARFVCDRCWTRSVLLKCARCGREGHDVGALGWAPLLEKWRSGRAFSSGRSMISPLVVPKLGRLVLLSLLAGIACGVAPLIGTLKDGHPAPVDLGIAGVIGLVSVPL